MTCHVIKSINNNASKGGNALIFITNIFANSNKQVLHVREYAGYKIPYKYA